MTCEIGLTRYVTSMGTPASASSSVDVPDLVNAAADAANASYLPAASVTRIGRLRQFAVRWRTIASTGPAIGTTVSTGLDSRSIVASNTGSRRETSLIRL